MDRENFIAVAIGGDRYGVVERHLLIARALVGGSPARVIDKNAAHGLRGDTEEVRASAPVDVPLIDELQERLVDERCGSERVFATLAPELRCREALELVVDHREQPIDGVRLAIREGGEESGDVGVGAIQERAGRRGV